MSKIYFIDKSNPNDITNEITNDISKFDFDVDTCRDKGPQIWRLLSGFGDTQGSLSRFYFRILFQDSNML